MRKNQLYRELATITNARLNCIEFGNHEWQDRHTDRIEELLNILPHGSGIDYTWEFDYVNSTGEKLIFGNSWHYMDENGSYDGVYDFTCTVTGSLQFGYILKINFHGMPRRKRLNIEDYLYEIIGYALTEEVEKA